MRHAQSAANGSSSTRPPSGAGGALGSVVKEEVIVSEGGGQEADEDLVRELLALKVRTPYTHTQRLSRTYAIRLRSDLLG
jgi:hypothetical protein